MLRASHCLLILVLAAVVGAGGTTRVSTQAAPMPPLARVKAADKVVSQAVPFDLADVRLLDGPFRDAMRRDQQYLLELDPDRLLHNFRVTAGLPSSAQPLGGWEAPTVELRGHSLGHFLSGLALMYRSTGDERFKTKADAIVAELVKIQQAE
ncbi:MAG: beta-L-arabinofuranosidase domain-containing protein, partial [Bacteroidales bacterium]